MSTDVEMPSTNLNPIIIERFRTMARNYGNINSFETALFLADKVCCLSNDASDIHYKAKCYYYMKQYHNAIAFIKSCGAEKQDMQCRFLLAKCTLLAKEYADVLSILNNEDLDPKLHINVKCPAKFDIDLYSTSTKLKNNLFSGLFVLKGRALEALDCKKQAIICYKNALQYDVHNYEALEALINHHMLTSSQYEELMTSLFWDDTDALKAITRGLYSILLRPHLVNKELSDSVSLLPDVLKRSFDVMTAKAEYLFTNCNYTKCFEITDYIIRKDPYNIKCLPLHCSCLIELKQWNKLFYIASNLIKQLPNNPMSWFIAGLYHYATNRQESARRYLAKALAKDPLFGLPWLICGHSYALDNEHDQAMTAYFKANELMMGSILPLLYIGLECGYNNNLDIAYNFFKDALKINAKDPFLLHELGVNLYQGKRYSEAEAYCLEALDVIKEDNKNSIYSSKWEPLFNNLGHICRKLLKYEKALEYHQQALVLSPLNGSTLAYIGFLKVLLGNSVEAVEVLHRSIALRPKDSFAVTLLTHIIEEMRDEEPALVHFPFIKSVQKSKSPSVENLKWYKYKKLLCPQWNSQIRLLLDNAIESLTNTTISTAADTTTATSAVTTYTTVTTLVTTVTTSTILSIPCAATVPTSFSCANFTTTADTSAAVSITTVPCVSVTTIIAPISSPKAIMTAAPTTVDNVIVDIADTSTTYEDSDDEDFYAEDSDSIYD